jgi:hypothetical protein
MSSTADGFGGASQHCTKEEFIALWRFTVTYLRDDLGVHNFIYAFSPDNKFNTETEFLDVTPAITMLTWLEWITMGIWVVIDMHWM